MPPVDRRPVALPTRSCLAPPPSRAFCADAFYFYTISSSILKQNHQLAVYLQHLVYFSDRRRSKGRSSISAPSASLHFKVGVLRLRLRPGQATSLPSSARHQAPMATEVTGARRVPPRPTGAHFFFRSRFEVCLQTLLLLCAFPSWRDERLECLNGRSD